MTTTIKIICTIGIIIAFFILGILKNVIFGPTSGNIITVILLLAAIGGISGVWKYKK